jgi:exodeoxyribonuclease VII large subunit
VLLLFNLQSLRSSLEAVSHSSRPPLSATQGQRSAQVPASARTAQHDPGYLSVTEVARLVNDILELHFPQLLFRGEISQITIAQSGHVYFSIKDEGAQIACVMWSGMARTLSFRPSIGMTVRCHGRPNVYAQSGKFQVIVHRLFEDGEGELRRRFLELQKRLEAEGFFAPERKRSLPFLPKAVGIVTSSTGAVIHDMMVKIRERFPAMVVYLADTRVQGEGAAVEIAQAIRRLDRSGLVDVVIVARGGGSLEDLWAFNEEEVVRAVFSCSRPVISGVGHEVDVTLCDFAADVRAPTPTAAAEMVVPKVTDLLARLAELEGRLRNTDRWFQPRVQRVDELSLRLQSRLMAVGTEAGLRLKAAEASLARIRPDRVLQLLSLRLKGLETRLTGSLQRGQSERARLLADHTQRLGRSFTLSDLRQRDAPVQRLGDRLASAAGRAVSGARDRMVATQARLKAVSPQAVLARGYSIVYSKERHVRSIADVGRGDSIEVRVIDGVITGTVD